MATKNHYKVLDVEYLSNQDEIKEAFRRLAVKWHPDRHTDNFKAAASKKFIEVMEAYEILGNPARRKEYNACFIYETKIASGKEQSYGEEEKYKKFGAKVSEWEKQARERAGNIARESYEHFSKMADNLVSFVVKGLYHLLDKISSPDFYEKAVESYHESLRINPDDSETLFSLGFIYYKKGEFEKSARCYKRAMSINPEDPDVYYSLGVVREEAGQSIKAMNCFKMAAELNPSDPDTFYRLAMLLKKTGDSPGMQRCMQKLCSLKRKDLAAKLTGQGLYH